MSSYSQRAPAQSTAPVVDSGEESLVGGGAETTESMERGEANKKAQRTPIDIVKELIKKGDGPGLVSHFAALSRSQPGEIGRLIADRATLVSALNVIGQGQASLALLHLQFGASATPGRALNDGLKLLVASVGLSRAGWMQLVAGRDAAQQAAVVADPASLAALRGVEGDPMDLLPGLSMSPETLRAALTATPALTAWIIEVGGEAREAQILEALAAAEDAALTRSRYIAAGLWKTYLSTIPKGPATDAETQRLLYNYVLASGESDVSEWNKLFERRFGVSLTDGGAAWDKTSVLRLWQICDLTPASHIEATVKVIREGDQGDASGWAGGGEIGMTWGTDLLGATEIGAYSDDTDPMRGLNIFDACVRHEIGHNVGESNGWDQPGGFVYTQFGWDKHEDLRPLLDVFVKKYPLPLTTVSSRGKDALRVKILDALGAVSTTSRAGYRAAVEGVQRGLWTQIEGEPLINYLLQRSQGGAWDSMDNVDGRSYHVAYDWFGFCSAPVGLYAKKVSTYAMRSPMEWFAEVYATFYAEADQPGMPLGQLVAGRDPALYKTMMSTVHSGNSLGEVTGQGEVGMPKAQTPEGPIGDFPTPGPEIRNLA